MRVNFNQTADTITLSITIEGDTFKRTAFPASALERYTFSLNHILLETKQVISKYMLTHNIIINLDITAARGTNTLSKFMLDLTKEAIGVFYSAASGSTVQELSKSVLIKTIINGKTKPRLYLAKNPNGKHNVKVLSGNASTPKELKNITTIGNMKTLVWVNTHTQESEYIETLVRLMVDCGKCDMFVLDEDFVKEQIVTFIMAKTNAEIRTYQANAGADVLTKTAHNLRNKDNISRLKEPEFLDVTFELIKNEERLHIQTGLKVVINTGYTLKNSFITLENEFYSDARNILITEVMMMVNAYMCPNNNFKIYWTTYRTFTVTGNRIDGSKYTVNLEISNKVSKTRMEYLVPMAVFVAEEISRYASMHTNALDTSTCDIRALDMAKTLLTME